MGCYYSGPCGTEYAKPNMIHENLVLSTLGEKLDDDDYLGRSHRHLLETSVDENGANSTDASLYVDIEMVHQLVEPGFRGLENGYVRRKDGSWYIAVTKDLDTITGEVFDWWLRNCDNTDRYKWAHPMSHKFCEWDPQFFAKQPEEREAGHYQLHSQKVIQEIAGKERTVQIEYDLPSKYFDVAKFPAANVKTCAIGRVHLLDPHHGVSGVGYVLHLVQKENGRNILRTRYWVSDYNRVDDNSLFPLWFLNSVGNSSLYRYVASPRSFARALYRNLVQEIECIKHFLPDFYRIESARQAKLPKFETRMVTLNIDDGIQD